ncbi:Monothiol glutaredoxin-S7, chloroplastic [Hordeum vulgare]|nr:Monothiol glutaredoxin-S7, chloroplastic [Hordeum vulgare]
MLEIEATNAKTKAKEVALASMKTGVEIMKVDLNTVSARKRLWFEKMRSSILSTLIAVPWGRTAELLPPAYVFSLPTDNDSAGLHIHPSMGSVLSSQPRVNGVQDNTMPPDLEIGQSTMEIDQCTIINILHYMLPCASPLGRALWGLGSLTLVLALTTALHLPAAGPVFAHYKAAYYTILAFVLFVAVPAELATAFYLLRCSGACRLLAFARGLLPCAYVLLLVVIAVGGFVPFKL